MTEKRLKEIGADIWDDSELIEKEIIIQPEENKSDETNCLNKKNINEKSKLVKLDKKSEKEIKKISKDKKKIPKLNMNNDNFNCICTCFDNDEYCDCLCVDCMNY